MFSFFTFDCYIERKDKFHKESVRALSVANDETQRILRNFKERTKIMKKIISVVVCACMLVSVLCLSCAAVGAIGHWSYSEPCWEGLHYGEFAVQGKRSAESTDSEFNGRIFLARGPYVPKDKVFGVEDFPGLEVEKIENLIDLFGNYNNYSVITLKDKSYESVINALKYLEDYKYIACENMNLLFIPRDSNGKFLSLPDDSPEVKAGDKYYLSWIDKYGKDFYVNDVYEGLFDRVEAEFKNGKNWLDKYDRRMYIGDDKYTYRFKIVADINTDNGVVRSEYFNGDADGNTLVNLQDAVRILKYVAHWDVTVENGADANMDNIVNVSDCVQVLKMIIDSMEADPVPVR